MTALVFTSDAMASGVTAFIESSSYTRHVGKLPPRRRIGAGLQTRVLELVRHPVHRLWCRNKEIEVKVRDFRPGVDCDCSGSCEGFVAW